MLGQKQNWKRFIQLHDKIYRLYCYIAFGFHSNPECSLSLFAKYLGLLNILMVQKPEILFLFSGFDFSEEIF